MDPKESPSEKAAATPEEEHQTLTREDLNLGTCVFTRIQKVNAAVKSEMARELLSLGLPPDAVRNILNLKQRSKDKRVKKAT